MKKSKQENRAIFFAELINAKIQPGVNGYSGAEIGVYKGEFSWHLMKLLPIRMYLVDPWAPFKLSYGDLTEEQMDAFYEKIVEKFRWMNCIIYRSTSVIGAQRAPDDLDFAFIDGRHDFDHVYEDTTLWDRKVAPGGIVAGHDYSNHRSAGGGDVIRAVNKYAEENNRVLHQASDNCWYWIK